MPGFGITNFNSAMPQPALLVPGSPDCALHRASGMFSYKELTITGTGGEVVSNIFTVASPVELLALYGIFTDVTNVVTVGGAWWDFYDGTNNPAISLDGTNLAGAALKSTVIRDQAATAAAYFGNSSQCRVRDNVDAGNRRPFSGCFLTPKNGVTNYIRFRADTDGNTNCKIWFGCAWVCRYPAIGGGVAPV